MESRILREGYVRFGGEGAETCRAQLGKARLPLPYYISEMLGKETLDTRNRSISKGSHGSSSTSYQQTGRELLTPDEVRAMDNTYAIVFIRGERPVIDKKYDILKHPNIKLTEDGGAAPYIHHPGLTFAQEDLSLPFEGLDNIIIIDEEELSNEKDR
ncbi:hypothetical protein C816_00591 [Oscillibacter sp. 1-3]|nr:hypothetical protein C816_00591 [Oscillibacter sp. 1-3]